jgi:tRNA 2-thiocytidine biosynthesis protein TtcA
MAHETDVFEQSITRKYRARIWSKFVAGIKQYKLLKVNDHVLVGISGSRDSMMLGRLFMQLMKHTDFDFKVTYVVVNDGFNEEELNNVRDNLKFLGLPADIIPLNDGQDVFNTLINYAIDNKCNLLALGNHYDDVIETTLMNMLDKGVFETIRPKEKIEGIDVIRPMYLVREKDIGSWTDYHELKLLVRNDDSLESKKRLQTKALIKDLFKNYNIQVEKNIFTSTSNVTLDMIVGYQKEGKKHYYIDEFEDEDSK